MRRLGSMLPGNDGKLNMIATSRRILILAGCVAPMLSRTGDGPKPDTAAVRGIARPDFGWEAIAPDTWRFRSWRWQDEAWRPQIGHVRKTAAGLHVSHWPDERDHDALLTRLGQVIPKLDCPVIIGEPV